MIGDGEKGMTHAHAHAHAHADGSTSSSSSPSTSATSATTTIRPYSTWIGFALTINLIIGTGAFGLPYAVYRAGTWLSLGCLLVFTTMSCICLSFVLESMARAGGILRFREAQGAPFSSIRAIASEYSPLLGRRSTTSSSTSPPDRTSYAPFIGFDKIDYVLMCELFGGPAAHAFVHVCMILYSFGVLWAYAAVFSSSVDTLFFQYVLGQNCNIYISPTFGCTLGYAASVLLFAILVVTLSLMDISDQAGIQKYLTGYRFAAFFCMIASCIVAWAYPNPFDERANETGVAPFISPLPLVNWSGFGLVFCTTAVALDVHWNVPDVIQPLRNKAHALRMTLGAMLCAASFYAFIGWVCAAEFGPRTLPLVSLNWAHYTGLDGGFGGSQIDEGTFELTGKRWAIALKLFIMLFPVFNQVSVYPLVCLTLGDNFLALVPEHVCAQHSLRRVRRACRLLASVPPLACALFFGKLDFIFQITGLFAFLLVFITPALLQLKSREMCVRMFGPGAEQTPYSSRVVSHPAVAWVVLGVGCVAIVFSFVNTVFPQVLGIEWDGV